MIIAEKRYQTETDQNKKRAALQRKAIRYMSKVKLTLTDDMLCDIISLLSKVLIKLLKLLDLGPKDANIKLEMLQPIKPDTWYLYRNYNGGVIIYTGGKQIDNRTENKTNQPTTQQDV